MGTTNIERGCGHPSIVDPALFGDMRKQGRATVALITTLDRRRLASLLELGRHVDASSARLLRRKMRQAHVVAAAKIPPTVVTMNSRVLARDLETRAERELTLVYPCSCGPEHGHVSVLRPPGIALLAATPGDGIRLGLSTWHVIEIMYQPEDAGDYHL